VSSLLTEEVVKAGKWSKLGELRCLLGAGQSLPKPRPQRVSIHNVKLKVKFEGKGHRSMFGLKLKT